MTRTRLAGSGTGLAALIVVGAVVAACANTNAITPDGSGGQAIGGNGPATTTGGTTSSSVSTGSGTPCPSGITCVSSFVFSEERDTSAASAASQIDSYDCSPDTNESGSEIVYRVTIPSDGFLSVAVHDGEDVDIDVHILTSFDPSNPTGTSCVARGDLQAAADVEAGDVWIIADSWADATKSYPGAYRIDIGFIPVTEGACDVDTGEMARVGDGGDHLAMPATGPVVMEAHLVTQAEPKPFPMTSTDELADHHALSQEATKLVMYREQVWAPKEGGGTYFGSGIGDPASFPVLDEGWYVNMYWTASARPPKGTRMILRRTDDTSRAVVVAAGYETGPGDSSEIAGTTEETHYYLGTEHESVLKLGIASDQSLPLGPRSCK